MRRFLLLSVALLSACAKPSPQEPAASQGDNAVGAAASVDTAGASDVARAYLSDLAQGRFADARARWDRDGAASGGSAEDLARGYHAYIKLNLVAGNASASSSNAGTTRTLVPVTGTAVLRRTNDKREMGGNIYLQRPAGADARAWRIWAADIRPKH